MTCVRFADVKLEVAVAFKLVNRKKTGVTMGLSFALVA